MKNPSYIFDPSALFLVLGRELARDLRWYNKSKNDSTTKNKENVDHRYMTPSYGSYKSMIKDDSEAFSRVYPTHTLCAYNGLRKPLSESGVYDRRTNVKCIPNGQSIKDCKEAARYYDKPGSIKSKTCSRSDYIYLCSIQEKKETNGQRDFTVFCDFSKCNGKTMMVGFYNEYTGSIGTTDWSPVHSAKALGVILRHHVATSTFGRGFASLTCDGGNALQVLTLPNVLQRQSKAHKQNSKQLNINLILEDSLSRSHFYRTLPKTTSALRQIVNDRRIPATVPDFEMIQSVASSTKPHLQRLFAARKYVGSKNDTHAVEEFFLKVKNAGYTTVFQECACWYDRWGTKLGILHVHNMKDERTRTKRWQEFVKLLRKSKSPDVIDDFGMMFLTCSAYSKFNDTNTFNGSKVEKACFHGRHFSSLFLEYVEKYVSANDMSSEPFFSYTHLYTSHENTGRRVVNDDIFLAKLLQKAARLSNTITIFASDHGGKATPFSAYTTQGRHEVFQPLLFMIVTHQVTAKLGTKSVNSLVINQKRLITIEDLHYALLSLLYRKVPKTLSKSKGIFDLIPLNRSCAELQLSYEVLCLCKGMDKYLKNDYVCVKWAAEYALGALNNKIQDQYITSLRAKHGEKIANYTGLGACQRYTGIKIERARQVLEGDNEKLHFSLVVKPFSLKTVEVFDVQVVFPLKRRNGITLSDLVRVSMYNRYEGCADNDGVTPKLCTCSYGKPNDNIMWQDKMIAEGKSSFSLKYVNKLVLDKPCLFIVSRKHKILVLEKFRQDIIVTYEAHNACAERTYALSVGIKKARQTRLSITGPFNVTVYPKTVTFLMTGLNDWRTGRFALAFTFKRVD